jgi:phosphoglycolate phosphatase
MPYGAAKTDAADQAVPTPGSAEFLAACTDTRRPIVIVSNNGAEAITAYLERHQFTLYVRQIIGRPYAHPELMKPSPAIVLSALTTLDVEPQRCVLVGDSITDIEVAHATGVCSIGYVKTPDRRPGLEAAGSDATVDNVTDLASATRSVGSARPN